MSKDIRSLVKEYHTFYEVSPYYILAREGHGSSVATTRRVHTGFDVDIYGVNTRNELTPPGPDPDYALGCCELKTVAEAVRNGRGDCSVEVVSFPSTAVINTRDHARVEATIRIRIAHLGNLGEPAGLPEQCAVEELEKQLKALGITRR
jgi:hypothetical protein